MLLRRDRAMTAVAIVLDVAFHAGRGETISAGEIAERIGQARRGIEPVMQALSRSGILGSTRGPKGGYKLGRAKRDIRISDIIAAAIDHDGPEDIPSGRMQANVVLPLWQEVDALCRDHLSRITVDDLLKRAAAAGMKRPAVGPLTFAI